MLKISLKLTTSNILKFQVLNPPNPHFEQMVVWRMKEIKYIRPFVIFQLLINYPIVFYFQAIGLSF